MQSQLASLSLLLSLTSALSIPSLSARDDNCPTGPEAAGPTLGPRLCPNPVAVSPIPNFYSTYLDTNPFYHYENAPPTTPPALPEIPSVIQPGEDSFGTLNPQSVIPPDWYKDCRPETLCANLDDPDARSNGMWMTDDSSPNCLLGYYLPSADELPASSGLKIQEKPTKQDCIDKIVGPMIAQVSESIEKARGAAGNGAAAPKDVVNRASVNVKPQEFPKYFEGVLAYGAGDANGGYIVPGWSRWIVEGYAGLPAEAQ